MSGRNRPEAWLPFFGRGRDACQKPSGGRPSKKVDSVKKYAMINVKEREAGY